jgi:hypothetical protein
MHRSIFGLGLVLLAAACGDDSSGPGSGFECLGAALPTTAPATVTVSGQIKQNALAQTALSGAVVVASRTGTDTLAADTSDTPGFYSLSIATGGTPVDGFIRVTKSGFLPTYAYPSRPLAANLANNNVLAITNTEFGILATTVDESQAAGNGFIGVVVKDCNGTPLAGATVQTSPAGADPVHYNFGGAPSSTATATAADGVAYVFNVAAGNVTVMATASGHTLRQHVVNARADVITLTEIQP